MKREQLGNSFQAWVYRISKAMNRIASGVLFFMMLLTIADVFLRKVFSQSILGTVEVTEFMMVILLFFAVTQTEILDGHVKVDLIMSRFGERTQAMTDMITQFVCFLLFGLFTWSTLVYAAKMRASGEVSQDLWLPVYPFIYVVALGCALLALSLLIKSFMAYMRTGES
ncbi:MAG: TRAP transporter small permease [Deltaproteobacteria bacterium]|nr:TRAP transporter small permease [Deltaproteobacteria bacterium]MBW2340025.1 TRAP transporter small permease [Deltaproteobacteria bacterium]